MFLETLRALSLTYKPWYKRISMLSKPQAQCLIRTMYMY